MIVIVSVNFIYRYLWNLKEMPCFYCQNTGVVLGHSYGLRLCCGSCSDVYNQGMCNYFCKNEFDCEK